MKYYIFLPKIQLEHFIRFQLTVRGRAGKCMIVCQDQTPQREPMIEYVMSLRVMMAVHIDALRMVVVIQNKKQKIVPQQCLFVMLEDLVDVKRFRVQVQKNEEMEHLKDLVTLRRKHAMLMAYVKVSTKNNLIIYR